MISIQGVDVSLGQGAGRVHILKQLSLDISAGEAVGIVGPSGSGKSTLLMVLAGLERPDSGSIRIDDVVISDLDEDALARFRGESIGIVFQSFHLIPNMTALENVAMPLEIAGAKDAMQRAAQELEQVGLGHRLTHYPGELSGGEQQRVALARAIAPRPSILIADEPTGNLDGGTGDHVASLIFDLQKSRQMTLVLVTHDPALAERCDRMVRFQDGHIAVDEVAA
ncbi:ABC transporter ATP-binding protein [Coralliovum pocilloporae]|uniref:ABC transporter ATP-binding protein n=1 Tax=Coralliovum pocilloporae TaxID=3066369 RepID=UPI0033071967